MLSCETKKQDAIPKKSNLKEINRLIGLAENHYKKTEFDSSYYYFNKAKKLCDVKKDTAKIIQCILNMADIESFQGDYTGCESTITETYPLLINNKKPLRRTAVYKSLASNNASMLDYKNALHYNNLALDLKPYEMVQLGIKNNIAVIYLEMHNYQKAINILEPLITNKELIKDKSEYARIINNLGECYSKTGNPKALSYLSSALKIRIQNKDEFGLSSSYLSLSQHFNKRNSVVTGFSYAQKAYKISTKAKIIDCQLLSLKMMILNSTGNQSKEYALKYIELNDSVTKIRQMAKNQFAKIKYDSKQDKDENLILKTQKAETAYELELQKNKIFVLIFISLMGIILTSFLYRFWKLKNKKEKLFTAYETETRISKRLHDELANDVYNTMIFAENQDISTADKKEVLLSQIETIYNRTRNISLENSEIDTSENFKDGLILLISGFKNDTINIIIKDQDVINWNNIKKSTKITVYRIVQELLVNMKKHSQCSLVVIGFETKENTYEISYSDNGVGSSKKLNIKNGLQNVENRIKSINGLFTFDTELHKGFKAKISFPH